KITPGLTGGEITPELTGKSRIVPHAGDAAWRHPGSSSWCSPIRPHRRTEAVRPPIDRSPTFNGRQSHPSALARDERGRAWYSSHGPLSAAAPTNITGSDTHPGAGVGAPGGHVRTERWPRAGSPGTHQ